MRAVPWIIKHRMRIVGQGRLVIPPLQRTIILSPPPPLTPAAAREVVATNHFISGLRILGVVLLIVGLVGTVLTTLYVVRGSRQRPATTA